MLENITLSFQGIWSHKLRSLLTMLGIIIGIASIIAIVSTIVGTNEQIKENLIGSGNNVVNVTLKQGDYDYWMGQGSPAGVTPVTEDMISATICAQVPYRRWGLNTYQVSLVTAKTPELTTATACSSAVTGVGATVASGSQR